MAKTPVSVEVGDQQNGAGAYREPDASPTASAAMMPSFS